ncbi:rab11 family-interacting protein 5 [Sceloporus undulatus]|uniref:rab11 family-interacting protein 5 n=1 Tax=Sceloporus undulatus TaxID=8520 RepID=UPI001C4D36D9|nr:rab11 family-interacting protein 5 [Sceloporus undulatus]
MSLESSGEAGLWPSQPLWSPTHLELALLGCRGLRTKGGSPSFWAEAQLGRQRLRLGPPASSSSAPKWQALELPPEIPDDPQTPPLLLRLSLWQKSLVGPERFLGALELPLGPQLLRLRQGAPRGQETRWYKLHSKPGKKEKERGEVQLSLQFTRQSLTASMFDLSAKEKPRSPFGRLKDKMKGRQKYDLESASAIVPGSCAALEDDLGLAEVKKGLRLGKGGFFFKGKLRKSSLTQSNTSLGSDSTLSSASSLGGIAGLETLTPSPSRHSSLSTDRSVRDFLPSPKLTHKRAFSDEVSQVNLLPESKSIQSLKPSGKEPISRSSLCINGSHIYCEEPSPKPSSSSPAPAPAPAPLPPLPSQSLPDKPEEGPAVGPPAPEPELPPWSSSRGQKGPPKDPPRFIPSPPILAAQEEDKLSVKTIALNKHRGRAKKEEALRAESRPVQIAAPLVFSSEVVRVWPHERIPKEEEDQEEGGEQETKKKKARSGFFRRRSSSKDSGTSHATAAVVETTVPSDPSNLPPRGGGEERGRSGSASSWFGRHDSKERKPSPHVVKPISSTSGPEMVKGDEGEKPKPSSTVVSLEDGVPLPSQLGKTEAKRDPLDRAAQYYHLTHEELVQLLQKREAELRKEKEHVRELENYIDRLLVRIMEQSPTLLQISLGREAKAAK